MNYYKLSVVLNFVVLITVMGLVTRELLKKILPKFIEFLKKRKLDPIVRVLEDIGIKSDINQLKIKSDRLYSDLHDHARHQDELIGDLHNNLAKIDNKSASERELIKIKINKLEQEMNQKFVDLMVILENDNE